MPGNVPDLVPQHTPPRTVTGMNILVDIIPAAYRRYVYAVFALAVLITGALTAGGVNVGTAPEVLAYIGGALGLVAAANTYPTDAAPDTADNGGYQPRHRADQ